jgi:hypothetical protein
MLLHGVRRRALGSKAAIPACFVRGIITGPTKTGSGLKTGARSGGKSGKDTGEKGKAKDSSSSLDSSFTFQLFLIVGAMGAGYTLGKTTILTSPPDTLFPNGSITKMVALKGLEKETNEREKKQYDMFKRCALRILEGKGIEVDVKYGKNESLYDSQFCNKDIAKVMNEEESMSEVFFGKDPKEWEDSVFVWYPETTEDVSNIMKNCSEFNIPVYNRITGAQTNKDNKYISFEIDFDKFEKTSNDKGSATTVALPLNLTTDEMNEKLGQVNRINSSLSAADLFFMGAGIKIDSTSNKVIGNKYAVADVDAIECVLPDGNVLRVEKDDDVSDYDSKLFHLLSRFQDSLCVITKVFVGTDVTRISPSDDVSLVYLGENDLRKLNENIQTIRRQLPNLDLTIIDIHNDTDQQLASQYGEYKTFAIMKLSDKEYNKVKGVSNIRKIEVQSLETPTTPIGGCFTDKLTSGEQCIIVQKLGSNVTKTYFKGKYVAVEEEAEEDTPDVSAALVRRLKLSIDSARVLNP